MTKVTGQQVYEYYIAVKVKYSKKHAVQTVSKLIEPILDEYVPFGLHKPPALAQILCMESKFLSSELSRFGNNPAGIKGEGYIGPTLEYNAVTDEMQSLLLAFAGYQDFETGVRAYCRLMMGCNYLSVRKATNYVDAAKQIKKCGYATDPDYVGDGDIDNQPIIGMLDHIEAWELDQFVSDLLDAKTRYQYIWRNLKKQSRLQYVTYWHLKTRIKEVQQKLNDIGFDPGEVDGWFGEKTKGAVIAFQNKVALDADSIVGIRTYETLFPEKFTATIVIPKIEDKPDVEQPFVDEPQTEPKASEPVTAHFCLDEFACKDGTSVPEELWANLQNLMDKLEQLRSVLGDRPTFIHSAYRHLEYNRKIGSLDTSQHIVCKAADIKVSELNPEKVYEQADQVFADGGVGIYDTFVHVDIRGVKSRWDGRTV